MTSIRIIGRGRAGRSFEAALSAAGFEVPDVLSRGDDLGRAARRVDGVLLAVPDRAVASVAAAVDPAVGTVMLHCSGALGLDVLSPHRRRAWLHPLVTLPDPVVGALRLRGGSTFAVAGDHLATELARGLGGHLLAVSDDQRVLYHAAACVAANHLVALLGQVQRVAEAAGLPFEAFLPLARGALEDVVRLGPARALTGPAARRDLTTLELHRGALPSCELPGYDAGVALASRLAEEQVALDSEPPVVATWS